MTKARHNGNHATETPDVSHIKNVDVTHEISDVNVGAILTFVILLVVLTLAVCVGLYFLLWRFDAQEQAKQPPASPMAMDQEDRLPPEPRLQNAPGFGLKLENGEWVNLERREPAAEYQELRKQWELSLKEGAKDQSGKIVGIPINDAMKIIAEKNLVPARTAPESSQKLDELGIRIPTFASSGRVSERLR